MRAVTVIVCLAMGALALGAVVPQRRIQPRILYNRNSLYLRDREVEEPERPEIERPEIERPELPEIEEPELPEAPERPERPELPEAPELEAPDSPDTPDVYYTPGGFQSSIQQQRYFQPTFQNFNVRPTGQPTQRYVARPNFGRQQPRIRRQKRSLGAVIPQRRIQPQIQPQILYNRNSLYHREREVEEPERPEIERPELPEIEEPELPEAPELEAPERPERPELPEGPEVEEPERPDSPDTPDVYYTPGGSQPSIQQQRYFQPSVQNAYIRPTRLPNLGRPNFGRQQPRRHRQKRDLSQNQILYNGLNANAVNFNNQGFVDRRIVPQQAPVNFYSNNAAPVGYFDDAFSDDQYPQVAGNNVFFNAPQPTLAPLTNQANVPSFPRQSDDQPSATPSAAPPTEARSDDTPSANMVASIISQYRNAQGSVSADTSDDLYSQPQPAIGQVQQTAQTQQAPQIRQSQQAVVPQTAPISPAPTDDIASTTDNNFQDDLFETSGSSNQQPVQQSSGQTTENSFQDDLFENSRTSNQPAQQASRQTTDGSTGALSDDVADDRFLTEPTAPAAAAANPVTAGLGDDLNDNLIIDDPYSFEQDVEPVNYRDALRDLLLDFDSDGNDNSIIGEEANGRDDRDNDRRDDRDNERRDDLEVDNDRRDDRENDRLDDRENDRSDDSDRDDRLDDRDESDDGNDGFDRENDDENDDGRDDNDDDDDDDDDRHSLSLYFNEKTGRFAKNMRELTSFLQPALAKNLKGGVFITNIKYINNN